MNTSLEIIRVLAFCIAPKPISMLENIDAWVLYTGDGFKLPDFLCKEWHKIYYQRTKIRPTIFIIGPDNLMLKNKIDQNLNADDFAKFLIKKGIPKEFILTDSSMESQFTHNQAKSFIKMTQERKWEKTALFTSWYHAPRAFLTTLANLPEEMWGLSILPNPAYELSFLGKNRELEKEESAWSLFNTNMLSRLEEYQTKGHCASFEKANAYIQSHKF